MIKMALHDRKGAPLGILALFQPCFKGEVGFSPEQMALFETMGPSVAIVLETHTFLRRSVI